MMTATPSVAEELRASLAEVVQLCPVERCNPAECPLFPLREMPLAERLRWFNALSEADLEYLAAYHEVCMGVKLAAKCGPKRARPR